MVEGYRCRRLVCVKSSDRVENDPIAHPWTDLRRRHVSRTTFMADRVRFEQQASG